MANQKAIENANRLKFVRALERFHKSILAYLSSTSELTKESYDKKVHNSLKYLERVPEVVLYKGELQELHKHVKKMIAFVESEDDIQNIRETLLYEANQLDKSKNAKRYKKQKHPKVDFDGWE